MRKPLTLTGRLLLFFLGALAAVLVGFSVSLWLLARSYLHGQASEGLEAALNTLAAAAEVAPDGAEWEPEERSLRIAQGPLNSPIEWAVAGSRGEVLDESSDGAASRLAQLATGPRSSAPNAGAWLMRSRPVASARSNPEALSHEPGHHSVLTVSAGVSLGPSRTALQNLGALLVLLSTAIWLTAFTVGRRACATALRPVTQMAEAAREMDADDLHLRLPRSGTDDELDKLGTAFNGLLDRLAASFERQRRFTGDASHQLRTPLAAVLGQLDVALRRDRTAEEYRRVLSAVHAQADHLRQIVESLLFLARADAEAQAPALRHVDLTRWLAGHVATWSEGTRRANVRLETELAECRVETHAPLLGELIDVLLDNAVKYGPLGAPVTVRLERREAEVVITVEDRGYGIRPEDLPHVFDPFFRAADARNGSSGGVGLGLAIADRLVRALGGRIEASSSFGQGSRFAVWLPASEP